MSNAAEMDAQKIINYIATAPKKTPVKLYVREKPGMKVAWGDAHVYGGRRGKTVFGDWDELKAILDANADSIDYYDVENDCRNSAVPMLDLKGINARIEPGAIIRDRVEIGDRAVIMMGAIINIGSVIGEGSMIDMGAVLGGRATVGKNCHIGAGTVLAGVVEPASATPVIIEDDVMIGANAVVLEGVRVGKGAVVAAGAVCVEDVPAGAVVAGVPARVIKMRDEKTDSKTGLEEGLRQLKVTRFLPSRVTSRRCTFGSVVLTNDGPVDAANAPKRQSDVQSSVAYRSTFPPLFTSPCSLRGVFR